MNLDDACRLAVNHLAEHGPSDITREVVEKRLITRYKDQFISDTRAKLNRGNVLEMEFKPIQYLLTPKNRYVFDYRKAAIVDPSCLAKYTCLALQAARLIENARIPVTEQVVFSSRFAPNGEDIFDRTVSYVGWRERIKELADDSECTYVVQCDIASFYDRVNIHRIESTLLDVGVDSSIVKCINDLLLFWSKKDSYGIPVGNSASRILAEAALIDVDNYLLSEGIRFVRYVDDYRLFAPSLLVAQRWMNLLTTRLFRDGLMLNTGKTKLYLAAKSDEDVKNARPEDTAEAVIRKVTKLTGGYNRIARTFVMPASEKYNEFKSINIREEISNIGSGGIPEFEGIQKLIVASLVQQKFDHLESLAVICTRYLYSLDYFVDMLVKNAELIPAPNQSRIADVFAALITSAEFGGLDWHQATLAGLLSHPKYLRKSALIHIVRTPTKVSPTYPSMIALEGLKGHLTRGDFRTIREWFDRSDDWERRRMLIASDALPDEERKAWAKAVKPIVQVDFFNSRLADDVARGKALSLSSCSD